MSISSSLWNRKRAAIPKTEESGATTAPITLSERSITGLALIRIFVGYLWFQQLFWKLPPDFRGLRPYIDREIQHTIIPGYGFILQHTFVPFFVPLAAGVWTAELVVAVSLLFGLFTRFGALLSALLAAQLYVGLAYAPGDWYWTYGMLVLLGLAIAAVPAGRRLGFDQWLAPRFQASASNSRFRRVLSWLV